MLRQRRSPKPSHPMIRSASLLVMTGALWAGAAHAQMSGADLVTRIDRLQAQVRELTGTVEELQYRNQQLEQEVQRLRAAAPGGAAATPSAAQSPPPPSPRYSSQNPAAAGAYPPPAPQSPAAVASVPVAAPPPALPSSDANFSSSRRGDAFDPDRNPAAPGAPRPLGTSTDANEPPPAVATMATPAAVPRLPGAPLDLSSPSVSPPANAAVPGSGDLPPPSNPGATGAMQAALPPGNTPKDEYDLAYGYVLHKDFALAEQTFRDFLHKYPSDRLAPEAQYWLGESLFQDKQYRDAAESFLTVSTKFENTARAPDALLRLGQSLAALGEKEAACASLGEVLRKYPRAPLSVKQSVDREQKRTHC
jgi:tol-pal system protein YbgF